MPDTKRNTEYEGVFDKAIIESIPGSFSICDVNGRLVCWNDYFRDNIIGKPECEMLNTDAMEVFHPDDKVFAAELMRKVFELGIEVTAEGRVLLRGGPKYQWRMITGRRITIGKNPFLIAIGIDINERKRFEALEAFRLRLLNMGETYSVEELLRATLDEAQFQTGSPRGFCQLVSDDNISLSLRSLSGLKGEGEAVDAMVRELLLPEGDQYGSVPYSVLTYNDYEAYGLSERYRDMRRALVVPLMQGTSAPAILCLGDKSYDYDDDDSKMVSALSTIVSDTVARKCAELSEKKMQEALLQAQKMELVGQLAGGIAHDFNNMLGVILGNVELALTRKVADESLIGNLQAILRAAEHSAGLTTQLLAFSRKQTVLPVVLELNLII
ncbi:MAG: PAS domain S-box protein [Chlorobium sp.]